MTRSLSIAATGMEAQQLSVEVIANNIANLSTTGFKRQRAEFQDLLYQSETRPGVEVEIDTPGPSGIQIGLGVQPAAVYRITEQGSLVQTGNTFDLAISGRGFFQVTLPGGENAYTRAGSFQVNGDGDIVTAEGYTVSPGVTIPADAVSVDINKNGEVLVSLDGQIEPSNVGQLDLVTFVNEAGLDAQGDNLFLETQASGAPSTGICWRSRIRHTRTRVLGELQRRSRKRNHKTYRSAAGL